ncbi:MULTISPECIES: hypothetical protein [Bacillus]|nr:MULTISPECIES: hypothetical protein [Bacillus]
MANKPLSYSRKGRVWGTKDLKEWQLDCHHFFIWTLCKIILKAGANYL